jgi:hypothetical protein
MQKRNPSPNRVKALPYNTILTLANEISVKHGLPRVSPVDFRRSYDSGIPMPIYLKCENGRMWVDKYYLAYELPDGAIRYAYITRRHIREECRSYRLAPGKRLCMLTFPDDIVKVFVRALGEMNAAEKNFWIS